MFNQRFFDNKYLEGTPLVSDKTYEKMFPNASGSFSFGNKKQLDITNTSVKKIYTSKELQTWKSKHAQTDLFLVYPKYDGINLFYDIEENKFYTRNNGITGVELNPNKCIYIKQHLDSILGSLDQRFRYLRLELLSRKGRQEVSGQLSRKTDEPIENAIVKIHCIVPESKLFNPMDLTKVNKDYIEICYDDLTIENLETILRKFRQSSLPLDGLVLIPCMTMDLQLDQSKKYSSHLIAFKKNLLFGDSVVTGCTWTKRSKVTPVILFDPITINGRKFSKVTTTEAIIKQYSLGIGSKIRIELAGDIVPKIVSGSPSDQVFIEQDVTNLGFTQSQLKLLRYYKINKRRQWFDKQFPNAESILDIPKPALENFLGVELKITRWELLKIFNMVIGINTISDCILEEINSGFDLEKIKSLEGPPKAKNKQKLLDQLQIYDQTYKQDYELYFTIV